MIRRALHAVAWLALLPLAALAGPLAVLTRPQESLAEKIAARLAGLDEARRADAWRRILAELDGGEALVRSWRFWGRPEQWAPGTPGSPIPTTAWRWWAVVTGRGWGKTRTAAEWVVDRCEAFALAAGWATSGVGSRLHRVLCVAPTAADARDTMVEGESGLLAVLARRGYQATYQPSKRRVTIPALRTIIILHSAERPDRIRGGQYHTAWLEEFAAWPQKLDDLGESLAYANADLALRLPCPTGLHPQGIITTTPKPLPPVRALLARAARRDPTTVRTSGSLYANLRNLAPAFVQAILDRYEGTRLGDQEVHGIMLDIVEGALWDPPLLDETRRTSAPDLDRTVVGVDPSGGGSGEAGIVAAGADLTAREVFVLEDASLAGPSEVWGAQAVATFYRWGASKIVAERNYGGDMVRAVIHAIDPEVPVELVNASKGKQPRAEPIATLTHRGRLHLVGYHPLLESQLVSWVPGDKSPDRLDAMVWAATDLFGDLVLPPAAASSPNRTRRSARSARWAPPTPT